MPPESLDSRYEKMQEIIRSLGRVAVAFSAGVDSTLVLRVAVDVLGPENVIAVTGRSGSLAQAEFEAAQVLASEIGAELVVLDTREIENDNYAANPENRCYYCKTTLYTAMRDYIAGRGITAIINGINADDYDDWRPGIQAAGEQAVRCPVAEAGLTKADIRELSRRLGLETYDKPASPCLASRVQYGERITPEKLQRIESCEAFLHKMGLRECRVRHHYNLARIEVPADRVAELAEPQTRRRIIEHFRQAGYNYVTLDLQGFRSGSMNEVIAFGKVQPPL
ncbi:MAG TPA: ATP-dependent sacrificial sulfur transferase LarE [Phycisphaerae bacterium]|nr:ATP-dependent sacrificial sulfur transferase LarE [Phycisphaerae bacterium]